MKVIIIDSNVIFRMITKGKESPTFRVLTDNLSKILFITPGYALHELKEHIDFLEKKVVKKTKGNSTALSRRLLTIFLLIKVLPEPFYNDKIEEARRLATFDEKDSPFIALQLKLRELGIVPYPIWTEDTKFLKASVTSEKFF